MTIIFIILFILIFPCCAPCSDESLPDLALLATEKSHSEIITSAAHTWQINIHTDAPIENRSITIEVLDGVSKNPRLKSSGNVDFSSLKAIVDDVTTPDMTEEEKALALWRFVMDNNYHGAWGTSADGLEHLNVYGYGYCGTFAAVLEPLWWAAGLKARHVNIGNHAATEVYYDNDWHYIDAHRRCFFLEKDNRTIASLDDLNLMPELWGMKRKKQPGKRGEKKYYYMSMHPQDHGRSPIYSNDFAMSKGDVLTLRWKKAGKWCLARGAEGGDQPAPEPPIYANGTFRFFRDFTMSPRSLDGLVSSTNIAWDDMKIGYLHPQRVGEEATLVYEIRVPYFIPSTVISGTFLRKNHGDFVVIDISVDNGQSWINLWKAKEIGVTNAEVTTDKTQSVTTDKTWKYSYLLRVRMRAEKSVLDVGAYAIESMNDLFYNPKSLPKLEAGINTIMYRDESESSRAIKVTYRWREDLPISVSKMFPLDKEEVTLQCRIKNIGRAAARNVKVVFYEGNPHAGGAVIGESLIKKIDAGATATAKIAWRASRWEPKSKAKGDGIEVYAVVDPDNSICELNENNNISSRTIKVLNPPEVVIPSESFIRFDRKTGQPDSLMVTATVRNFSGSPKYGYYLDDHASAENVVVKFFDGDPDRGKQIGGNQVIKRLKPLEFKNVSVDWDISRLTGKHTIYVQVLAPENVVKAFGPQKPHEISATIDLDTYRQCIAAGE